jgi:hypothetical protein
MDTGLIYKSLGEELLDCPKLASPDHASLLIDLIISRESSWLHGTILLQNLLSCLQFEDLVLHKVKYGVERLYMSELADFFSELGDGSGTPEAFDKVFEIYLVGVAKSTGLILAKSKSTVVSVEEEKADFEYGGNYLDTIETKDIIALLEVAMKWVRSQKKLKSAENDEAAASSFGGLLNRLEFRTELLYVYNEKKQPKKSHITRAVELVDKILQSLVTSINESTFDLCFSNKVQSRVSNTNPLRSIEKHTIEKSYASHKSILTTVESYREVHKVTKSIDLLSFFVSTASKTEVLTLARTFLQVITQVTDTHILGQKVLNFALGDLKESTGPTIMHLLEKQFTEVDNTKFLGQLELAYDGLLKANMVNRSRQRQLLSHCIVVWDSLQIFAEEFEDQVNQLMIKKGEQPESFLVQGENGKSTSIFAFPISSWTMMRKVQIMIWVVLLGFELDIYKIWEYGYMYRYAAYLVMTQASHLQRTLNYLEQTALSISNNKIKVHVPKNKTGKAANQSAIKKAVLSELQQCIQYITTLATEADAVHYLCDANKHLSEAAVLAGYTCRPETMTAHTSPELLYGLRMKPFSSVGVPEQPGFERMMRTTPPDTPEETLTLIKEKLAKAKRSSDWCKNLLDRFGPAVVEANTELKHIKRSAIGISVSSSILEKYAMSKFTGKETAAPTVSIERRSYHWFFPVLTFRAAPVKK